VEFVIRFRRENALEVTLADTLTVQMELELLASELLADPMFALLSKRANATVVSPADSLMRMTIPGVLETVLLSTTAATTTDLLLCAMPSKRASAREVTVADTVTSLAMPVKTVVPSPTSLPTARLECAMPSREVNASVETAAASVTEVLLVDPSALPECVTLSREVSVREATAAATLTRLSRHKHYRTINRTI